MDDLISRQAAIGHAISGLTREIDGERWIRVAEVRESLKTMPSAQPERKKGKCEDFDKITEAHEEIGYEKGYRDGYAEALADMERSEDVTNRHIQRDRGPEDQM